MKILLSGQSIITFNRIFLTQYNLYSGVRKVKAYPFSVRIPKTNLKMRNTSKAMMQSNHMTARDSCNFTQSISTQEKLNAYLQTVFKFGRHPYLLMVIGLLLLSQTIHPKAVGTKVDW